jgi:hypothetical protein
MRTKICIAAVAALAVMGLATGHAKKPAPEPSAGCAAGEVTPSTTPAGIALDETGTPPRAVDVRACNTGAIPVHGAATVHVDPAAQNGYVDVDGDSTNAATRSCADGFARVMVNSAGPHFYEGKDGSYADTNPKKKGKQRAKEEDAQTFVTHTQTNCAA